MCFTQEVVFAEVVLLEYCNLNLTLGMFKETIVERFQPTCIHLSFSVETKSIVGEVCGEI